MTDPTLPPVVTPAGVPGQRGPADHPRRPDLAPRPSGPGPTWPAPADAEPEEAYARWWQRVAATVLDLLLQVPFVIGQVAGYVIAFDGGGLGWETTNGVRTIAVSVPQLTTDTWIGLAIATLAGWTGAIFSIWNSIFRQGRRGASIGKQAMNLVVVSEHTGRPIGALLTFVRQLAHLMDSLLLGIGYLWPLWDRRRQTFADMAMKTVVLHLPALRATPRVPAQAPPPYGW